MLEHNVAGPTGSFKSHGLSRLLTTFAIRLASCLFGLVDCPWFARLGLHVCLIWYKCSTKPDLRFLSFS